MTTKPRRAKPAGPPPTALEILQPKIENASCAVAANNQADNDFLSTLALTSIAVSLKRLADRYCPPIE